WDPQVLAARSPWAPAREDHLEPVASNRRSRVPERTAELRNQDRDTPRIFVSHPRGRVDVEPLVAGRRIVLHREIEGRDAGRLVLEVRRPRVGKGAIHGTGEDLGQLPGEVVPLVVTPGNEQVGETTAATSCTVEVQPVTVWRKRRRDVVARGVDVGSQVLRRTPRIVIARAMRDPDIAAAQAAGTIGGDV